MPGRILIEAERERWNQFPTKIAPSDLVTHFTLSTAELDSQSANTEAIGTV